MILYVDALVTLYKNPSIQKKCKLEGAMLMPCAEEICKDVC